MERLRTIITSAVDILDNMIGGALECTQNDHCCQTKEEPWQPKNNASTKRNKTKKASHAQDHRPPTCVSISTASTSASSTSSVIMVLQQQQEQQQRRRSRSSCQLSTPQDNTANKPPLPSTNQLFHRVKPQEERHLPSRSNKAAILPPSRSTRRDDTAVRDDEPLVDEREPSPSTRPHHDKQGTSTPPHRNRPSSFLASASKRASRMLGGSRDGDAPPSFRGDTRSREPQRKSRHVPREILVATTPARKRDEIPIVIAVPDGQDLASELSWEGMSRVRHGDNDSRDAPSDQGFRYFKPLEDNDWPSDEDTLGGQRTGTHDDFKFSSVGAVQGNRNRVATQKNRDMGRRSTSPSQGVS